MSHTNKISDGSVIGQLRERVGLPPTHQENEPNTSSSGVGKRMKALCAAGIAAIAALVGFENTDNTAHSMGSQSGTQTGMFDEIYSAATSSNPPSAFSDLYDRYQFEKKQPALEAESRKRELQRFEVLVRECSDSLNIFESLVSDQKFSEALASAHDMATKFQKLSVDRLHHLKFNPTEEEKIRSEIVESMQQDLCGKVMNALEAVLFSEKLPPEDRQCIEKNLLSIRNSAAAPEFKNPDIQ